MLKRQTKLLLVITILIQISSYFIPFVAPVVGYEFFKEGVDALLNRGIKDQDWHAFYAFFAPILSFPILLLGLLKSFSSLITKGLKAVLFISLLCPVLLSIGLITLRSNIFSLDYLGYILWVISFCLMYGIFFFKNSKKEEIDMDDLNKHLIEDEM